MIVQKVDTTAPTGVEKRNEQLRDVLTKRLGSSRKEDTDMITGISAYKTVTEEKMHQYKSIPHSFGFHGIVGLPRAHPA